MQVTFDLRGPETFDTTPRKGFSQGGTYAPVIPGGILPDTARCYKLAPPELTVYTYIEQDQIYSEIHEKSRNLEDI